MNAAIGGIGRGLGGNQAAGPAVDGKREMRVGGIARGKAVDGDREEQDQRGGDGLVVVDPREEAREEGGFCGRHGDELGC